ncbi:hypothetical protein JB92DRAFT_3119393 [Gautieria morchelliformis]|nr:hypothetical protein JB92DRAFT_3119393 [Gautieria morchelliformis]
MTHCRLPQEMVDAILDNLCEDDGHKALLTCSQVCHSWLPSSQRNLFRRITFGKDGGHSKRLGQALLSSPHLAKYIRELEVHMPVGDTFHATCQTLSVILGELSELQRLTLCELVWHKLTVDLRESFRRLFLLSSISFVKLHGVQFGSMDDFVNLLRHAEGVTTLSLGFSFSPSGQFQEFWPQEDQEDQGEHEGETRLNLRERRHLDLLHLYAPQSNFHTCVDCLLEPRSPLEVSHIQSLLIDDLEDPGGDAFNRNGDALNRLLHPIGSSLQHLQFYMPDEAWSGRSLGTGFDINLEFNSNIKLLHVIHIDLVLSRNLAWLLRFLPNIATSNQLEHILFDVIIDGDTFEPRDCSVWKQVDCLLAQNQFKFQLLRTLDIKFWVEKVKCDEGDKVQFDEIAQSMVAAHPLLLERGVSVNVWCVEIAYLQPSSTFVMHPSHHTS